MNSHNYFIKLFFLCVFCSFISIYSLSYASTNPDTSKDLAYQTISKFCKYEFEQNFDRDKLIKMSDAYKDKIDRLTGSVETLYIPDVYEVFAIKSYKILDVSVNGNKAVATISYDVLAKRTGWITVKYLDGAWGKPVFVEYHKPNYVEKINLVFDGVRWLVLDPPFPKISIEKVIDFLNEQMKRFEKHHPKVVIGQALPGPQSSYDADKQNIALLKKLAD